jgi:hypothetical protein
VFHAYNQTRQYLGQLINGPEGENVSYMNYDPGGRAQKDVSLACFGQALFNCGVLEALQVIQGKESREFNDLDREFILRARQLVRNAMQHGSEATSKEPVSFFFQSLSPDPILLTDADDLRHRAVLEALAELARERSSKRRKRDIAELTRRIDETLKEVLSESTTVSKSGLQLSIDFFSLFSRKSVAPYLQSKF